MTNLTGAQTQWEQLWLPLFPLASDELFRGVYRQKRESALERRFIEANPQALSNLLVVDVDHNDALYRCLEMKHGWVPNAVVENPNNGHAHAVWALAEPVTRTDYGSRKAIAYAAAITEGLRRSVDGDAGYSGLMTKNPTHEAWRDSWFTDRLYSLPELESRLSDSGDMPSPSWNRKRRRNPVGLGRNCSIFETARTWAYREIRHYWGEPLQLRTAIQAHVHGLNAEFTEPLPTNEAHHIAESIWRWITTRSRLWQDGPAVYEATFSTIQAARGRKSGQKRRTALDERQQLILGDES